MIYRVRSNYLFLVRSILLSLNYFLLDKHVRIIYVSDILLGTSNLRLKFKHWCRSHNEGRIMVVHFAGRICSRRIETISMIFCRLLILCFRIFVLLIILKSLIIFLLHIPILSFLEHNLFLIHNVFLFIQCIIIW